MKCFILTWERQIKDMSIHHGLNEHLLPALVICEHSKQTLLPSRNFCVSPPHSFSLRIIPCCAEMPRLPY